MAQDNAALWLQHMLSPTVFVVVLFYYFI